MASVTKCSFFHCIPPSISAYKDLQSREDTRNAAWQHDGWDEVVYYTGKPQLVVVVVVSRR